MLLRTLVFLGLFASALFSHADSVEWQVFGGSSYLWYPHGTKNQLFNFNDLEQDQLVQFGQSHVVGLSAGVKRYVLFDNRFVRKLGIGAVLRYEPHHFNGEVYRDMTPFWNDFTYRYTTNSRSEQLTAECVFNFIKVVSPYVAFSVGATQASLSYRETAQPWISPSKARSGASEADMMDVGFALGLQFELSKHLMLNTEYLYQHRGDARVDVPGIVDSIPINLNEKSVNLQLGYLF